MHSFCSLYVQTVVNFIPLGCEECDIFPSVSWRTGHARKLLVSDGEASSLGGSMDASFHCFFIVTSTTWPTLLLAMDPHILQVHWDTICIYILVW